MSKAAKYIVRAAGVAVGIGAAVWALRDLRLPSPDVPEQQPPPFREHAPDPVAIDEHAELITLHGIGPATADRLKSAGIMNVPMLAGADASAVSEATGASITTVERWIETAKNAD